LSLVSTRIFSLDIFAKIITHIFNPFNISKPEQGGESATAVVDNAT
jgi:hypothetical protein